MKNFLCKATGCFLLVVAFLFYRDSPATVSQVIVLAGLILLWMAILAGDIEFHVINELKKMLDQRLPSASPEAPLEKK